MLHQRKIATINMSGRKPISFKKKQARFDSAVCQQHCILCPFRKAGHLEMHLTVLHASFVGIFHIV